MKKEVIRAIGEEKRFAVLCGVERAELFPASVLGADFVKAVKAPLSGVQVPAEKCVGIAQSL